MPFSEGDFIILHVDMDDDILEVWPVSGGISAAMSRVKQFIFSDAFKPDPSSDHVIEIFDHRGKRWTTEAVRVQIQAWMKERAEEALAFEETDEIEILEDPKKEVKFDVRILDERKD